MNTKNLGEGLVKLTPSIKNNKIKEIFTQKKYSVVVCKEETAKNFVEEDD